MNCAAADDSTDQEAAYTRTITQRADRIVATLGIADPQKATRVRDAIARQYRDLRTIHDAQDAARDASKSAPADDDATRAARQRTVDDAAAVGLFALHRTFVARLSAELTAEQVEQVKDGMTYGVVPTTYHHYLELLPDLTTQQQAEIRANLLEAREYAMDAGSSEAKHAWFGKYKGRVNNYLSAQGYDLKKAEAQWSARRKAATNRGGTP